MGAIQIPRIVDTTPGEQPGQAPTGGIATPNPSKLAPPDYSGIIQEIRSGYNQAIAGARNVHEEADIQKDAALGHLAATGVEVLAQAAGAIGRAQTAAQEKQDSLFALRTVEQYRQEYDMAVSKAGDIGDPDTYLGTTNAIRAQLMKKYGTLGGNDNQKYLIERGITEYNIAAEHSATVEYNKRRVGGMVADANEALDLAKNRAIYTDDTAQIQLANQTKNAVIFGGQIVASDKVLNVGGLGGLVDADKQRELGQKWNDSVVKGRLEREIAIRPAQFLAEGYKDYGPGGRFAGADPNSVSEARIKAQAVIDKQTTSDRATYEWNLKEWERQGKAAADKMVSAYFLTWVPGASADQRATYADVQRLLEDPAISPHISPDLKARMIKESLAPYTEGGVTNPRVFEQVQAGILTGDVTDVQTVLANPGLSRKDAIELAKQVDARQGENDPVAKRWEYKDGTRVINTRLGQRVLDPLGLKLASDTDAKLYTDTLIKFDSWAHSPGSDLSKAAQYANDLVDSVLKTHSAFGASSSSSAGGGTKGPGATNFEPPSWLKPFLGLFGGK